MNVEIAVDKEENKRSSFPCSMTTIHPFCKIYGRLS